MSRTRIRLTTWLLAAACAANTAHAQMLVDEDAPPAGPASPTEPARRPAARPAPAATPQPEPEEMITLPAFSEPWQLDAIITWVGRELGVNILTPGQISGEVSLAAPHAFPKSKLMRFLDGVLEQQGYTITYDQDTGFYFVQPIAAVPPVFEGEQATTAVIRTPNVKPSLLLPAINGTIRAGGSSAPGAAPSAGPVTAIDELGVLIVTSSPRTIRTVQEVVDKLLAERALLRLHRIELDHIAASVARDRLVGLAGGDEDDRLRRATAAGARGGGQAGTAGTGTVALAGVSLSNLGDRLTIDAQGNALLFKGTPEELGELRDLIALIDIPNSLPPKNYFAGSAAQQVADIASQRGLGEVVVLEDASSDQYERAVRRAVTQQNQETPTIGGPVMVVDPNRGSIIYYGTDSQHAQLRALLDEIGTADEMVVIRTYVLEHSQAEDVADTLDAIISGRQRTGESALLPGSSGAGVGTGVRRDLTPVVTPDGSIALQSGSGDDVSAAFDPDEVIVVPDIPNNQIVVRAPVRQQDELGRLIGKLDLRRPQVYIEAIIVSVSDTNDFNLAVETQILNGQYGIQTAFGLSSANSTDGFQGQRTVAPNLSGLTAALVQSESIPFIINALQTDTDARIVSRPSLLVNNNEEASIVSLDQQPVTQTNQGETTTTVSFDRFEDAGTTLNVLPTISDGGYLRLAFTVQLSSFTGVGSDGIPSPRTEQEVESVVTVPGDAAIVVGGIRVKNHADTIIKIPLLGDIPLIGHAFRDTNKFDSDSIFYIFIIPKIMTDPNFRDLKLVSSGPQAEVDLDEDVPPLDALIIPIHAGRDADATGDAP